MDHLMTAALVEAHYLELKRAARRPSVKRRPRFRRTKAAR
jgi:hypothetical protein